MAGVATRAAQVAVIAGRKAAILREADTTAVAVPQVDTAAVAAVVVDASRGEGTLQEAELHTLPVTIINEMSGPRFPKARAISFSVIS